MKIIPGKVRPLSRRPTEAHPQVLIIALAARDTIGGGAALLYMDINQFKFVNDTYGHDTGDELLVEMAKRLRAAVPLGTLICRVGGDEFIVVLDRVTTTSAAVAAGNGILHRLQAEQVQCTNATLRPSVSMGISCLGDGAETAEELLSQADLAMFEAKKNRLDECVAYNDVIGSRHQEKTRLRAEVSDAIGQSSFRMVYQPIVDARDSSLFGIEALVRWRVRDEEVPAAEIVALAEAAKQTGVLGRWILGRAFEDYVALGRSDLQLHVNLSPEQVLDVDFLNVLIAAQRESGIDPAKVCLELTELAFNREPMPAYMALCHARDLGFSLAIDDFGVEYASMTNLMHVPVDWLKIDRSFVEEVPGNERVNRLVRGQIAVAAAMETKLIAEGVETREQSDWLLNAGCVLQQGFLHGRPTETEDLPAVFETISAVSARHGTSEGRDR
ncbi:MAG: EAL domain-containing protein [Mycobacterium sp.]